MNLGYTLPNAEVLIKSGVKIHTLREDPKDKWFADKKIHHCTGVRTKKYRCFLQNVCKSIQGIVIYNEATLFAPIQVIVNDRELSLQEINVLAVNDGFNSTKEFIKWFFKKKGRKKWVGKIIHWTDKRY